MTRPGPSEVTCEHGYDSWRTTRDGQPVCPLCRRRARAEATRKAAQRARYAQPRLDIPALVAHDDSLNDNVISISAARTKRRRRTREI